MISDISTLIRTCEQPSSDQHEVSVTRAVEAFLICRELKHTCFREAEPVLPIFPPPLPKLAAGDEFLLSAQIYRVLFFFNDNCKAPSVQYLGILIPVPQQKPLKRVLVILPEAIIIAIPSTFSDAKQTKSSTLPGKSKNSEASSQLKASNLTKLSIVEIVISVQDIKVRNILHNCNNCRLNSLNNLMWFTFRLKSIVLFYNIFNIISWETSMKFSTTAYCAVIKQLLEKSRFKLRALLQFHVTFAEYEKNG